MSKTRIFWIIVLALAGLIYWQLALFVVQPIGAVPQGATLLLVKNDALDFIDSPDGICARETGQVNLICRGTVLAKVLESSNVITQLPYSVWLYKISTGGKTYSR